EQDDQHHDHDGGLDHVHIADPDVRQVVAGGRGAGQVRRQRGPGDGFFDDVGDPAEPLMQLGCAHYAGEHHRQIPGFVVLAGHRLAQGGCVDEVLQHHDVVSVRPQVVGQCAVGGEVGGVQTVVVGQHDQ